MAYKRYIWVDEESQLDAYHLNNIEDGIEGIIDGDLTVDKANKDGDGNIITESYGSNIKFNYNPANGVITLELLAKDGTILQTSSIDLPTEYLIKEIYLDDTNKNLVFVLSNDTEIKCDISAIYNKIDTKVSKLKPLNKWGVYTQTDNDVTLIPIDIGNTGAALVQRNNEGRIKISKGVENDDAVNVEQLNGKVDKIAYTGGNWKAYTIGNADGFLPLSSEALANAIVTYDGQGKIITNDPVNNKDALNLGFGDNRYLKQNLNDFILKYDNTTQIHLGFEAGNPTIALIRNNNYANFYVNQILRQAGNNFYQHIFPAKSGTFALTSDLANYTPISETNDIKALIPAQANKDNQLADKNFVNSSINSSAAYFIGSFVTYADLLKWQNDNPTKATNNDYAYVEQDETHNNEGWRYIYVKTDEETVGTWKPQFKVNDTPFTAAQLAAINSNITSDKVTTFDNHVANKENPHGVTKEQVGLGNVDNTSDLDKPISNATSTALENLTKVMPTDINVDSDGNLILEHDGTEITGQKKQVVLPPFSKESSSTFTLDDILKLNMLKISNFINFNDNVILMLQYSTFKIRIPHTSGNITYTDYDFNLRDDTGGRVALTDDIDSAIENNLPYGTNADIDAIF